MSSERVHLFGIRHHGPGSARSLERALERLAPDCLLIEGPPDAEPILPLAAHAEMVPPVALLVYVPQAPRQAAFYPFAKFSPEWRAIRYGLQKEIPTRFIDLPQWHQLVEDEEAAVSAGEIPSEPGDEPTVEKPDEEPRWRYDPLGVLAEIAGFSDGERWWDHLVESRRYDEGDVFAEVRHAMTALREQLPPREEHLEEQREAYMRRGIRLAIKEGFERIAVVCGAWHVPALDPERFPAAARDNEVLKGLKKVKTEAAWSPWTYDRLASASGYGAGVISPAWYELLWSDEKNVAIQWMTRVAQLMRQRDLDASSAHVIEAVRLSESLAALRGRPLPGLGELREAALSVVCGGQEAPMALIHRRLIIGQRLGAVPEDSPMAPLQRDLAALQKRLRMPASSEAKQYDFDLRKPIDLERSQLLHRLNLLAVPWGEPVDAARGAKGTFHEYWRVEWQPEFAVRLIEASHYGSTIEAAATARTIAVSEEAGNLRELTQLLSDVLLAALPTAVEALVSAIQRRASTGSDVPQLMAALPALARSQRYGNVRQTDQDLVASVVAGVVERICIGLPPATTSLNDEAAAEMFDLIQGVHSSLQLLERPEWQDDWLESIVIVAHQPSAHPLVRGRAVRLLYDAGRLEPGGLEAQLTLATSPGISRPATAAWFEGFLRDSGLILVHDAVLWNAIHSWIGSLGAESFIEVLPLLRRTFATFQPPERRQIGEQAKRGGAALTATPQDDLPFNYDRAARVVPLVMQLLGREVADG